MGLNIKNEEVHDAVRELARVLGVSQTSAVEVAVRAKLAELDVRAPASRAGTPHPTGGRRSCKRPSRMASISGQVMEDLYDPETGLPR